MEVSLVTWEDNIEFLIERGYADDEIEAEFDRDPNASMATRDGQTLFWGALHDRRRVLALLAATRRGAASGPGSTPTADEVRRKQAELEAAVAGWHRLARLERCTVSESTSDAVSAAPIGARRRG